MEENKRTPFRRALLDATLEDYQDIPAEEDISLEFSDGFLRKSDALLRKTRRTGKTLRRIILVAAMIAVVVAMAVMGSAQRTYLFQYTITEYYSFYEFKYTDAVPADAPDHLETFYRPTYIPEGYELREPSGNSDTSVQYEWFTEGRVEIVGADIVYAQRILREDDVFLRIQKKTSIPTTIDGLLINGYDVLRIVSDIGVQYFWTDGKYFHYLAVDPSIPQEEHMRIFQSIAVDPDPILTEP